MKKYLKTPEEVIDALQEGKTVFAKSGERYKLYKGLVVGKLKKSALINSYICETDEPYIEEPESLKIEVGKFYKTRGGEKARCFCIEGDKARLTIDGCYGCLEVYLKTGCACSDGAKSDYDIIGPWED